MPGPARRRADDLPQPHVRGGTGAVADSIADAEPIANAGASIANAGASIADAQSIAIAESDTRSGDSADLYAIPDSVPDGAATTAAAATAPATGRH